MSRSCGKWRRFDAKMRSMKRKDEPQGGTDELNIEIHEASLTDAPVASVDETGNSQCSDRRDDVDGLRAIAVICVIIYHLDKAWL